MSRIGRKPIAAPKGVAVKIEGNVVAVQGPEGQAGYASFPRASRMRAAGRNLVARSARTIRRPRSMAWLALWSTTPSKASTKGWTRELGNRRHRIPRGAEGQEHSGLQPGILAPDRVSAAGRNRSCRRSEADQAHASPASIARKLDRSSAEMRSLRPPDPYKNKGVRYAGERLKKKVG